jgi:hypothetical protein
MRPSHEIDPKYVELVKRYEKEKNPITKIQMKYKFADWLKSKQCELTDAEIEYLQEGICKVNLID